MQLYEYQVVPAPSRGEKARGVKTPAERFSHALTSLMNEQAQSGWEFIRADTLPADERSGLTKRVTVYHSVLVFRRALPALPEEVEKPYAPLTTKAPEGKAPPIAPAPLAENGDADPAESAEDKPKTESDATMPGSHPTM